MKRVYFGDMKNLAAFMIGEAKDNKTVYAIMFYDEAKDLLRELMLYHELDVWGIEIAPPEWDGYCKEFYLAISGGQKPELYVNKAYMEKKERYLGFEADCLILDNTVSSKIESMNMNDKASVYEAVFMDDECVSCDDCEFCACHRAECDDEQTDQTVHFDIRVNGNRYTGSTTLAKLLDAFME